MGEGVGTGGWTGLYLQKGKVEYSERMMLIFRFSQSESPNWLRSKGVVTSVCNDLHISSVDRGSPDLSLAAILIASIDCGSERTCLIISGEKMPSFISY